MRRAQKARETRKSKNICTICGTAGHFATECMNERCGKCAEMGKPDETGHLTKNCPYLTEKEKMWFIKKKANKAKSLVEKSGEGSLEGFNMTRYIGNLPCGLNVNQAMTLSSKYTKEFYNAVRKSKEHDKRMDTNLLDASDEEFTATRCSANINGYEIKAIIDTGAACCAITRKLMEKLDMEIKMPSNISFRTADGSQHRSLGRLGRLHFTVGGIRTHADLEVIESKNDEILMLGTNWQRKNNVIMDFGNEEMEINGYGNIPIEFMIKNTEIESEDEYENENVRQRRL